MSKKRTALGAVAVAALAAATTLTVSDPAQATPGGPGVVGKELARATVGGTDYILREITIPPGEATGWHYHLGTLHGVVRQGTLSHYASTCTPDGVYPRGDVITEPAGADNVHIGINRGAVPVVLDVLYVLPTGSPLSVDAADPGCELPAR